MMMMMSPVSQWYCRKSIWLKLLLCPTFHVGMSDPLNGVKMLNGVFICRCYSVLEAL